VIGLRGRVYDSEAACGATLIFGRQTGLIRLPPPGMVAVRKRTML
jgi:hypothetical protein